MSKPFELIFFIAVMAWIGSIMIAEGPRNRIEMICKPAEWGGRVAGSVASMSSASAEEKTQSFFRDRTKDCQMIVFKQFYEETYQELQRSQVAEEAARRVQAEKDKSQ